MASFPCCRKCVVSGHVQGVFYRDTTRRKARTLEISGWAINLRDGTVEVVACGKEDDVNALCDWLWQGSRFSRVDSVSCEPWTPDDRVQMNIFLTA